MIRPGTPLLIAASVVTLAALILWAATGRDYYTKYQIVETLSTPIDPTDPLAQAGFYATDSTTQTVLRDEFRFGLLPTPSGLFDKHIFAVSTVIAPFWGLAMLSMFRRRRAR